MVHIFQVVSSKSTLLIVKAIDYDAGKRVYKTTHKGIRLLEIFEKMLEIQVPTVVTSLRFSYAFVDSFKHWSTLANNNR
jgi:hypothetical protein